MVHNKRKVKDIMKRNRKDTNKADRNKQQFAG